MSGRRDSNPRPTAWKAVTLPPELLPPTLLKTQNLIPTRDQSRARDDAATYFAIPHNDSPTLSWSGRRDSNPRPTAWKAVTLPPELLPPSWAHDRDRTGDLFLTKEVLYRLSYVSQKQIFLFCLPRSDRCGEGRIRTSEGKASRFTVCPVWPLWNLSVQITNGKRQKGILSLRFLPFYWEPPAGIEPATPSLQVRCSTNWAMVARDKRKDVIFL